MKYGPLDIKRMKPNDRVWALMVDVLWRELPGLYVEKYVSQGDPDDPTQAWVKGEISDDVDFGIYLGQDHKIEGNRSVAIGQGLNTKSFMEILLGAYATIAENQDPEVWKDTDRLVAVGNGIDAENRSLALELFKSGLLKLYNAILIGKYDHRTPEGELIPPANGILSFDEESGLELSAGGNWIKVISRTVNEQLGGVVNGINRSFYASSPFRAGTINVFVNGLREKHFVEINDTTITLDDAPLNTGFMDTIEAFYTLK